MGGKWLQLLKEIAPDVASAAILFNPTTTAGAELFYLQSLEAAAPSSAVKSKAAPTRNVDDIQDVLSSLARDPNGGLVIMPDTFTTNNRELITSLAARLRLPAIYPFR